MPLIWKLSACLTHMPAFDAVASIFLVLSHLLGIPVLAKQSISDKEPSVQRVQVVKTNESNGIKAELLFDVEALPYSVLENRASYSKNLRLKISRSGQVLLDTLLPVGEISSFYPDISGAPIIQNLNHNQNPDIIINVEVSGASYGLIYSYDPLKERYSTTPKCVDNQELLRKRVDNQELLHRGGTKDVITTVKTNRAAGLVAQLSYESWFHPKLKVIQGNSILFDQVITLKDFKPAHQYDDRNLFQVYGPAILDLDGDKRPEVILHANTGGSHCCALWLIYHYGSAQKRYVALEHDWGYRPGMPSIVDLDHNGIPAFKSIDTRFAYTFGGYAGAVYPIQIWQYRQGKMVDVTRHYPKLISEQASRLWKQLEEPDAPANNGAILAAYLADKYLLGQGEDGWQQVRKAYRTGEYDTDDHQKYFDDLRQLLKKLGYMP